MTVLLFYDMAIEHTSDPRPPAKTRYQYGMNGRLGYVHPTGYVILWPSSEIGGKRYFFFSYLQLSSGKSVMK